MNFSVCQYIVFTIAILFTMNTYMITNTVLYRAPFAGNGGQIFVYDKDHYVSQMFNFQGLYDFLPLLCKIYQQHEGSDIAVFSDDSRNCNWTLSSFERHPHDDSDKNKNSMSMDVIIINLIIFCSLTFVTELFIWIMIYNNNTLLCTASQIIQCFFLTAVFALNICNILTSYKYIDELQDHYASYIPDVITSPTNVTGYVLLILQSISYLFCIVEILKFIIGNCRKKQEYQDIANIEPMNQ